MSLGLAGFISFYFTSEIVKNLSVSNLTDRIRSTEAVIEVSYQEGMARENRSMDAWGEKIVRRITLSSDEPKIVQAENQETHEKTELSIPRLAYDGKTVSDDSVVDEISANSHEDVTFFARTSKGLYRVSTTVKRLDGKRAVGTYIPATSPIYETLSSGKRYAGRAKVIGQWYTTAYEPIMQKGELIGAYFMGVPDTSLERIKAYLRSQKLLKTGYFFILDSQGQFVLHPTREKENAIDAKDLDGKTIFKDIIEKKEGLITYRWLNAETKQAQDKIAVFRYFPQFDWYLSASLNSAEVLEPTFTLKIILLSVSLAMTVLMGIATMLFGRRLGSTLSGIADQLVDSSDTVRSRSERLTDAASALSRGSESHASALQETAAAVEEIRATVTKNLSTTEATENRSQLAANEAELAKTSLSELVASMSRISTNTEKTRDTVETGNHEIETIISLIAEIENKTKVIDEIVFQTKLLSFNASVEAARSGEHGKGFAVVAEEVGRLAQMSGTASKEIRESLVKNRANVSDIISRTQKNTSEIIEVSTVSIREGLRTAETCREVLEAMTEKVSSTHAAISQITLASKEQAQGIEEITKAMQQIDEVSQKTASVAKESEGMATELSDASQQLNTSVANLRTLLHGESEESPRSDVDGPSDRNQSETSEAPSSLAVKKWAA